MGCDCKITCDSLQREIIELRRMVFNTNTKGYKLKFTTSLMAGVYQYTLPSSTHKLTLIRSVMVLNQSLENVVVFFRVLQDQSVYIESNFPMQNFTLIVN